MAISDDNTLLATSSSDETIRIWNLRTSKLISVLKLKLPPRVNYRSYLIIYILLSILIKDFNKKKFFLLPFFIYIEKRCHSINIFSYAITYYEMLISNSR